MKTTKRSVGKKQQQTRKYSKKGGNNKEIPIRKKLNELSKFNNSDTIITYYDNLGKINQQNLFIILTCIKLIVKHSKTQDERFNNLIRFRNLMPNTIKNNPKVLKAMLMYEPYIYLTDALPKTIRKKEVAWRTALKQDISIFFLLDKQLQKHILDSDKKLFDNINNVEFNMAGNINLKKINDVF